MPMKLTNNEIWHKASYGDPSIISDPRISTLRDEFDWTPLHLLAWHDVKEAWFHPDFDKVKNKNGKTPKDWWIKYGYKPVTCTDFIND